MQWSNEIISEIGKIVILKYFLVHSYMVNVIIALPLRPFISECCFWPFEEILYKILGLLKFGHLSSRDVRSF